ncbi:spondin domain-containing protein [Beggiatoa alba]|nr:spondin domain-containing protein [Beggiatoa alba]
MKSLIIKVSGALVLAAALISCDTMASDSEKMYEVTITNISHGEFFTPVMVASHKKGVKLFKLGEPASTALEDMAESGNTNPLKDSLLSSGQVLDVAQATAALPPGKSVTLKVRMSKRYSYISVASMLVPSNDAFIALNGMYVGNAKAPVTVYSPAYDAGSELNDELCVSIPGPGFVCRGEGTNLETGEGYVHIHPGIQGIADLDKARFDWRNPTAKITIRGLKN